MLGWILEALVEPLSWLVVELLYFLVRRKSCPKCHGRLKHLPTGAEGERVQCVKCERVWLKGEGWRLRPATPAGGELKA
jgi:hypothetical protein